VLNGTGRIALALASHLKRSGGVIINEHTLNTAETRHHVDVLSRAFDFIELGELPTRLQRPRHRPFCLLTFDDGKRSNASQTAPELLRLGVPAVFYVVTRFVDDNVPLWFDRYHALAAKVGDLPPGLGPDVVKQLPYELLVERLDRACARFGVNADIESDDVRAMSWNDVLNLRDRGFTIGAHGCTHTVLTRETLADALENIGTSISEVSRAIGEPCRTFAFPNGNYTAELAHHAVRCGATSVMTTDPTWVDPSSTLWRLPRIQLFGTDSAAKITHKLALASTGRILNNPDGTGRVYSAINRLARVHLASWHDPEVSRGR
jgi:peptidoglycan/xylan/chitin deacetylase (PgdA/CDA1 family)